MSDYEFTLEHSNDIHIPHLSASTINAFITSRYDFYERKVRKVPFVINPFMARGKAVEHAVNELLEGKIEPEDMVESAMSCYEEEMKPWHDLPDSKKDIEKESAIRAAIPGLVECAFQHFEPILFDPFNKAVTQKKIEIRLNGVERPVIGYLDYYINGMSVRDCKVASRTPSALSQGYVIQGALYQKATGLPVFFDFIVDNKKPVSKSIMLTEEEYSFGISYATRAAQLIEELETCDDPRRVMEIMSFPDLSSMWSEEDRREAKTRWGF